MADLVEKPHLSYLLISHLFLLLSFIFSDPLYLAYFIFLSPYLLKLISFLSPVLFTTCLFITADTISVEFPVPLLLAGSDSEVQMLKKYKRGDELQVFLFEDEVYEVVFGVDSVVMEEIRESPIGSIEHKICDNDEEAEVEVQKVMMDPVSDPVVEMETLKSEHEDEPKEQEKKLNFFKLLNEFEKMAMSSLAMKSSGKVRTPLLPATLMKTQSVLSVESHPYNRISHTEMTKTDCEDEEKRKLGSKSFDGEQRRKLDSKSFDDEGMDSLWEETYVAERRIPLTSMEEKRKCESEASDEEDEVAIPAGDLCGLLGLKLSAGKINGGIGRQKLAKISKVIKGLRWLNHVSKKIHDNGQ